VPVSPVSAAEACRDLDAALDRMAGVAPKAARRASRALETILARWSATLDGPHAGRLTTGGFPVEIVCTSLDAAVRYTSEVAGPAVAPLHRLQIARTLLATFGLHRPFPLQHIQDGAGTLGWGAWLGGRHTAAGDSYKVYAEATRPRSPGALAELREALNPCAALLDSHVYTLRFAGIDPASGDVELYFHTNGLQPRELARLMARAGVGDQYDDLLSLLEDAARVPVRERLPGHQHGVSLAFSGPAVKALSFFTFASSALGDDGMVRRRLLALAERRGWDLGLYEAISAPLAARRGSPTHHGIVSWMVPRGGPVGVSVGLRPPAARAGGVDQR
jgi:hypothetical protein